MHSRTGRQGFTLIELLVVIAIIGMLSSVVLASLNGARVKARDARRLADLKQIQVALELYYSTVGTYPSGPTTRATDDLTTPLTPTYISTLPKDPLYTGDSGYRYCANAGEYTLLVNLEKNGTWCRIDSGVSGCWGTSYSQCAL